ncbi:MAG: D-amino acid aminotransferase [Janthinobacterium lividum]
MQALPTTLCYLNGDYTPVSEAKISVLDRGFIFGDGIYEVVPVYGGKLFRFHEHLARLDRSLASLRIANPHTAEEWLERCRRLIAQLSAADQMIYIQVTRGVAPRDHAMPQDIVPTVFMMVNEMKPPGADLLRKGAACVTASDFRWERADIKSTSLLGNVLARQISVDAGATETILLRDGLLTEASSSNVWVVRGGAVFGAPKSKHVLEGIRYELIRELCEEEGIAYDLRPVGEAELRGADELILSSASKEVLPVTRLDGQPVGSGEPGPVFARLHAAYQRAKLAQSI